MRRAGESRSPRISHERKLRRGDPCRLVVASEAEHHQLIGTEGASLGGEFPFTAPLEGLGQSSVREIDPHPSLLYVDVLKHSIVDYNKPLYSCSGDRSPPAKSMSIGGRKIGPKRKGCHVTFFPNNFIYTSPRESIPFGVHPLLKPSVLEPRSKTSTAFVIRTIQSNQRREHSNAFRMEGPRAEKRENKNYTGITTKQHKHERQIIKCEQSTQSKHDQH